MSKLSNMALSSSMAKDERLFRMKSQIKSGKTLTVQSCQSSLGLSRGTILSYLKELNMSIYDGETKDMSTVFNDETDVVYPF